MNEKIPKVSVVIPTYNRGHLVSRAIRSVLDQTYQNFEVIVVDDASTDNTEKVVKKFNDKRIKYIRHERNRGGSAARNTGIKTAQGEYIAFQDSDDEWLPEKLEKQVRVLENAPSEVGVVYTGIWRMKDGKKTYIPSSKINQKEGNIHDELLRGSFVTTQAAIVKNETFRNVGLFDERLPRLQDWELFIRISNFYEFKYIDEPLVISYFTPNSISANQEALIKAHKLIFEKHFQDFRRNRRLLASCHYSIGNLLCQSGKMEQGRNHIFSAIKSYPLNIKYPVAAFISFLGKNAYVKVVRLKRRL